MFVNYFCASKVVKSFNVHIYFEELVLRIENGGSHTDSLDLNLDISNEKLFKKLFHKCDNFLFFIACMPYLQGNILSSIYYEIIMTPIVQLIV